MSILKIGSNNPKLSYILSKNPATIRTSGEPFTKPIRRGNAYGWFSKPDDSEFKLFFKDSDTEVSFANNQEFEYLDQSRYNSPYAPIALITSCLATALKTPSEFDIPEFSSYAEFTIKVSNKAFSSAFIQHSAGIMDFELKEIAGSVLRIKITGNSVQDVLNMVVSYCLIQCLHDSNCWVDLNQQTIEFFLRALNRIKAPYFIRYIFNRSVFRDKNTFNKYRSELQLPDTVMNFGDTQRHRYDAIRKELPGSLDRELIDIGCGELYYTKRMAKNYSHVHAYDADPEIAENNVGKVEGWGLTNVDVWGEMTPEFVNGAPEIFEGADILLTEVIEHMEEEDAISLLDSLARTQFNKIVVTVPNKDFNVNYDIGPDGSRHSDHKWEPTMRSYSTFMEEFAKDLGVKQVTTGIGDSVNNVHSVIMTVFERLTSSPGLKVGDCRGFLLKLSH
jgi:2-polyprenyl-3-methyl-5-hydroxy-6-metoxy-1,4-benzoquinol methylase